MALSLAVAVLVVFQVLLVDAERELDSDIRREADRVREYLAVELPGALGSVSSSAPGADELVGA
ncbi:MAG: hypothetical protein KDB63_06360, partial [Nocardioidaceae bacterium]|nr:hypothetical protein [Nocardioidaceae bacterium]